MMTSFTSFLTTTTLLALAFGGIAASVAAASVEETSNNNWEVLDVNLPTPLSDNTATHIKSTDTIGKFQLDLDTRLGTGLVIVVKTGTAHEER